MNLSRLSWPGKLVAAFCTLLLILSFSSWQQVCTDIDGPICSGRSAWQSVPSALAVVLIAALWLEVALTEGTGVTLPKLLISRLVRVSAALAATALCAAGQSAGRFTDSAIGGGLSSATDRAGVAFLLTLLVAVAEFQRPTPTPAPSESPMAGSSA